MLIRKKHLRISNIEQMDLTIRNTISEITRVQETFSAFTSGLNTDEAIIRKSCIVIDEVLSNIISHGYEDEEVHKIRVRAEVKGSLLHFHFIDDGIQFNPLLIDDSSSGNGNPSHAGGLGIKLMKRLVDDIDYERRDHKNHLIIGIRLA